MKYLIRSTYHDWTEVDRVTFEQYKEKVRLRYEGASHFASLFEDSETAKHEFIKKFTKTEEEK